ncbi:MAG: helix-turn-helix domain-containing protein [Crocosphaera sp.]
MSTLIESLLYQSESTALDFKKEQYSFQKATDEQKSELLKDILAFANSWRQDDAYIVIGVEEVVGDRHIPVGTEDHFDDSRLQQFINGKTNRKVKLAYEVHLFEGKKIGLIRIPKQERPIYATKNYGKVKKEAVYYRLGSSTQIANPDDIARMGKDFIQETVTPVIDLQFADIQNRQHLGNCIKISSIYYNKPYFFIEDYRVEQTYNVGGYSMPMPITQPVNSSYWRDKEEYIRLTNLLQPVAFVVHNKSNILAENVRIELINDFADSISILDELPSKPSTDLIRNIGFKRIRQQKSPIDITYHGNGWTLNVNFGNIQPKSCVWLSEHFFLGSMELEKFEPEIYIYADNLSEPQKVNMSIDFTVENRPTLTIDDLGIALY